MTIDATSTIGATAGLLTIFNMFPQYLKVMKTKHTQDLSRATFVSMSCSSFLWIIYGVLRSDVVIIFPNAPVFFFCVSILVMKLKYK